MQPSERQFFHEGVPEWVRRTLQSHDRDLDVIYYRWWAGNDGTTGRFLAIVRRKSMRGKTTPPIQGDGQINWNDWAVIFALENDLGVMEQPGAKTIAKVILSDRANVEPEKFFKEMRRKNEDIKKRRQQSFRKERAHHLIPEAQAGMRGRVMGKPIKEIAHAE